MDNSSITAATQYYLYTEYFEEYVTESPVDLINDPSRSISFNEFVWPAIFVGLTIGANLLSLLAFCVEKRLRTYNNYFIINLSIIDLLIGLGLIVTVTHAYLGRFPFSEPVCKLLGGGLKFGFINTSNFSVVVICVDRYRATYDPMTHYMSRSKRRAIITCSIAWVTSLVFWLGFVTVWETIVGYDSGPHCVRYYRRDPITNIVSYIALFYLPFAIIAVLNVKILLKIQETIGGKSFWKDVAKGDPSHASNAPVILELGSSADSRIKTISGETDSQELSRQKTASHEPTSVTPSGNRKQESPGEMRKATVTLLFIVVAFVIAWLPSSIIGVIYSIEPEFVIESIPRSIVLLSGWMTFANSLFNPISYAISQPLFRSTIISMMLCRRK